MAEQPACAYLAPCSPATMPAAMSPFEGDARLISATTATPETASCTSGSKPEVRCKYRRMPGTQSRSVCTRPARTDLAESRLEINGRKLLVGRINLALQLRQRHLSLRPVSGACLARAPSSTLRRRLPEQARRHATCRPTSAATLVMAMRSLQKRTVCLAAVTSLRRCSHIVFRIEATISFSLRCLPFYRICVLHFVFFRRHLGLPSFERYPPSSRLCDCSRRRHKERDMKARDNPVGMPVAASGGK